MKTIKTEIKLYKYDELEKESKEKAFNEHKDFLRSNEIKEDVEESIRINEYWFFECGEMAHTTHFTGKHEKAGTTEFYFQGKTYII